MNDRKEPVKTIPIEFHYIGHNCEACVVRGLKEWAAAIEDAKGGTMKLERAQTFFGVTYPPGTAIRDIHGADCLN